MKNSIVCVVNDMLNKGANSMLVANTTVFFVYERYFHPREAVMESGVGADFIDFFAVLAPCRPFGLVSFGIRYE